MGNKYLDPEVKLGDEAEEAMKNWSPRFGNRQDLIVVKTHEEILHIKSLAKRSEERTTEIKKISKINTERNTEIKKRELDLIYQIKISKGEVIPQKG